MAGVVIVGAGPAGLLLAHLLLAQPEQTLPVQIYEAKKDPCTPLSPYKSRQYVVGLSARGRNAVEEVDGLWPLVQAAGVATSEFVLHFGERSIPLKRNPDKASLLINQRALSAALLTELQRRHGREKLEVHYETRCVRADFNTRTVQFEGKKPVLYDLLVGADGARSTVREEFIRQRGFDYEQINSPYMFKVLNVPRPPQISDNAVHSFRTRRKDSAETDADKPFWLKLPNPFSQNDKSALRFSCFPSPNDRLSVLIQWSTDTVPEGLLQITSSLELKTFIERNMAPLKCPLESADAFIEQRPTSSMKVRCSRFYDARGKAVLVGDAAHAMSNALGQGCNSSLQDAVVLAHLLRTEEYLSVAIERYSRQQVKEDHAAAYLSENAFPTAKWLVPFFLAGNVLSSVIGKAYPDLLPPSIQSLCSEALTPYSEIVQRHSLWLSMVEFSTRKI